MEGKYWPTSEHYFQAQKFATHADIRELLLSTGTEEIIEQAADDYYWGCGSDKTGKNRLGQILMEVRTDLLSVNREK